MKTTSNRRGGRLLAIPLALALLACGAAPASAADVVELRPATTTGVYDPVINTFPGDTTTRQVPFRVRYNGITNHLLPGVQVRALPSGVAPANVTQSPSPFMTIPIGWTVGSTVPSDGSVSIVAPANLGRYDYALTWNHEPIPNSYCDISPCIQSFAPRTYNVFVQPRAASSLAATTSGSDASVTWNVSPDDAQVTGYTITRQIAGNPGSLVSFNAAPGTNSRNETGLASNTQYCWSVRAYYTYSASAASLVSPTVQTCATTGSAPTAPGVPAGPAIDVDGNFDVAWAASTDPDGDDLTYTLETRDANDAAWSEVADIIPTTSYDVSLDEGTHAFRVRATDATGLSSAWVESTVPSVVDGSPPEPPVATTTPASPVYDGWFKDSVEVAFGDSTDPALNDGSPGTGVADYTDAITVTDHGSTTVSGTATDTAGNESDPTEVTVKVDATAPVVELTCPTDPILENTSASATWTASDTGSGVAAPASGLIGLDTSSAGTHTATAPAGTATDNVGHDSAAATCEYEVFSNSAPSAPGAPAGPAIDRDGDYTVSWTASTDPDGDDVTYTLETRDADDADWTQVADDLTATSFDVSGADEGAHSYRVRAADAIGASDWTASVTPVVVDGTPPSAPTASTTPAAPVADGWFKDSVVVAFGDSVDPALADGSAGTGVADYTDAVTVTDHGSTTVSGTATDGAGNESDATETTVKVDATAPTVEITCPTDPVLKDAERVATWTAADTGSGLAGDPAGSVDLDTSTPGTQTASVTVADKVGHEATDTCEYEVFENHAPVAPGAPAGPATDRDGDFDVTWSPSTDPDGDDVTYTLDTKDADDADWSLVADGLTDTTYAIENAAEGSHSYRVRAVDTLDAQSDAVESVSPVVVDGTGPSAPEASTTPAAPAASGWFKDTVTVAFDGSNDPALADGSAGTGVASYSVPVTFDTEGTHVATGNAVDGAGNDSAATSATVKVDTSVPVVQITCPTTPLLVGTSGNASWTASDTGSGLATAASGSVALDTSTPGPKTANAPTATDKVGHDSAAASCTYAVYSNVAPGAPGAPGGPASDRDGNFTVSWNAAVDPDGDALTYTLEKKDANDASWSGVATGITATSKAVSLPDGSWSFRVRAVDPGGQTSDWVSSVMPVKVDSGAPTAPVASTSPAAPVVNGWFKDTVTVSFAGSTDPALLDGSTGSGVVGYTPAQTFATEGPHNAVGRATDAAGNDSAAVTKTVKVDATAPVVEIACPTEPLVVGQTGAKANWTAADNGSGLATAASGSVALDTSHAGTRTASAPTAKDKVGHTSAVVNCEYEVAYRFSGYGAPFEGSNVVNIGLGNRTYKVRWQLKKSDGSRISDAEGVALAAEMNASSRQVECLSYLRREENDLDEELSASAAGQLKYDTYNNVFVYAYKAPRRGCHVLSITDADGVNTKVWRFLFL